MKEEEEVREGGNEKDRETGNVKQGIRRTLIFWGGSSKVRSM